MGAEQQWVAVQQKTFTKWYDVTCELPESCSDRAHRLNSKVNPRDVHVNDLVTDLSDGVSSPPEGFRAIHQDCH